MAIGSVLAAKLDATSSHKSRILHSSTFYKKKYIDKINQKLGRQAIKDIIFRMGKVEKKNHNDEDRDDYMEKLRSIKLEDDEISRIDEIVEKVEDEDMRNSLREIFISQSKLSKFRNNRDDLH
jgi:hypothetical protein